MELHDWWTAEEPTPAQEALESMLSEDGERPVEEPLAVEPGEPSEK
jgi:hypothetical protein